uniref:Myosin tail domain-containing protein n=1 Tax=Hucho hucho TaxID=62062 RepID=A0A4W5K527_9TELE
MEATSRGRDEAVKQLRKIQAQMKELQREVEDSRTAQKEVLSSARESERRAKTLEASFMQLQEVQSSLSPTLSPPLCLSLCLSLSPPPSLSLSLSLFLLSPSSSLSLSPPTLSLSLSHTEYVNMGESCLVIHTSLETSLSLSPVLVS